MPVLFQPLLASLLVTAQGGATPLSGRESSRGGSLEAADVTVYPRVPFPRQMVSTQRKGQS